MKPYSNPKIKDFKGDLSKRWYVAYCFRNPKTNKMQGFKEWISSALKNHEERYAAGKKIVDKLNQKLLVGFNPFGVQEKEKTLVEALRHICSIKAATCGKRSKSTYKYVSEKFITWLFANNYENLTPKELNKYIAQTYLDDILVNQKLSNRTYNNQLIGLRTIFNDMVQRDYIEFNVFTKIPKRRKTESDIICFTAAEKNMIKQVLPTENPPLFLAAMFVYYAFIRPAELVRMQVKHIHINSGFIILPASKTKNHRTQPIVISEFLRQLWLKMEYDKLPPDLYVFSNNLKLTPGTKEIAPTKIATVWKEYVKDKLGINKGIYLLKHTGAGELIEAGADTRNIQLQLRHSSLEQTQIYTEKFANKPSQNLHSYFRSF